MNWLRSITCRQTVPTWKNVEPIVASPDPLLLLLQDCRENSEVVGVRDPDLAALACAGGRIGGMEVQTVAALTFWVYVTLVSFVASSPLRVPVVVLG